MKLQEIIKRLDEEIENKERVDYLLKQYFYGNLKEKLNAQNYILSAYFNLKGVPENIKSWMYDNAYVEFRPMKLSEMIRDSDIEVIVVC